MLLGGCVFEPCARSVRCKLGIALASPDLVALKGAPVVANERPNSLRNEVAEFFWLHGVVGRRITAYRPLCGVMRSRKSADEKSADLHGNCNRCPMEG